MKMMSLRLDNDLYDELQIIAAVRGHTVSSVIRHAIAIEIDRVKADPTFQEKLDWHMNRMAGVAERLED